MERYIESRISIEVGFPIDTSVRLYFLVTTSGHLDSPRGFVSVSIFDGDAMTRFHLVPFSLCFVALDLGDVA